MIAAALFFLDCTATLTDEALDLTCPAASSSACAPGAYAFALAFGRDLLDGGRGTLTEAITRACTETIDWIDLVRDDGSTFATVYQGGEVHHCTARDTCERGPFSHDALRGHRA